MNKLILSFAVLAFSLTAFAGLKSSPIKPPQASQDKSIVCADGKLILNIKGPNRDKIVSVDQFEFFGNLLDGVSDANECKTVKVQRMNVEIEVHCELETDNSPVKFRFHKSYGGGNIVDVQQDTNLLSYTCE